jgi:hypothetical protein
LQLHKFPQDIPFNNRKVIVKTCLATTSCDLLSFAGITTNEFATEQVRLATTQAAEAKVHERLQRPYNGSSKEGSWIAQSAFTR